MSSWNELHYARAQEFVRLVADALVASTAAPAQAPAPGKALAGALFRTASPALASPAHAPAAPPAGSAAPGPTAAAVFNKIPWKK